METLRQTRFSDVCGTVDELKRMMNEGPEARTPQVLVEFVQDCVYMLERMELRLGEFHRFRDEVAALSGRMGAIGESRRPYALKVAEGMVRRFQEGGALDAEEAARLSDQAEEVRQVAGEMEQLLRRFKEGAMQLGRLCREVKGGRGWGREGREAEEAGMEERLAAWLPPAPHRERILDYLKKGRAHLLPAEEGAPPLVQFEDGGAIALSAVRYSEAVSNFVPASFDPSPRAQLYRGRGKRP
jgi:hypothetical protein